MANEEGETALRVLQRNDPATTSVDICLAEERDDSALAHALWEHDTVTDVNVSLRTVSAPGPNNNQGYSALRQVLSTHPRLKTIRLVDSVVEDYRSPDEIVKLFMESVQKNNAVGQLNLSNLRLPEIETVAILEDMPSTTRFSMYRCTMAGTTLPSESDVDDESRTTNKEDSARAIADALRRNQTIQTFIYVPDLGEPCMLPIVQGLVANEYIQNFFLDLINRDLDEIGATQYETLVGGYLEAASQCQNLQQFSISGVESELCFRILLQAVPRLRQQSVRILLGRELSLNAESRLSRMLNALKRNFKLINASVMDYFSSCIFDDTANQRLGRYLHRNKCLAEWLVHPGSVPKHLWPEALAVAQQAGAETLWKSLLAVGAEVSNHGQRKRKRERTSIYDPSKKSRKK